MLSKFISKYWLLIVVTISLVTVQSIISLYLRDLISDSVDKGIVRGDDNYIWRTGGRMLVVSFLSVLAAVVASYTSSVVSMGLGKDLRNAVFTKVTSFSLEEIDKFTTSSLITRTTNDVMQIQQAVVMILRMVVMAPIMAIGGIFMAVQKDAKLTATLLISVPVMLAGLGIIAIIIAPLFKSIQRKIDKLNLVVRERVTGIRVIRAFNKEDKEMERFRTANFDLIKTSLTVNRIGSLLFPYMMIIMNLTIVAIIWFGAKQIDKGILQVGQMMAVMQYVMQIMFSFIMISVVFIFLPRASVSSQRIKEILETEPKIKQSTSSLKYSRNIDLQGVVEFDNVTFSYPGANEPVLKNISFKALPGKVTAVVGATGSGKSTLLNLIVRFYDPVSGNIKLDGVDIREFPLDVLRSQIGYATQKAIIFSGSIKDNIRFGREWITDDMINHAAEIAQVTEFSSKYPEGLEYKIEQGGLNLSGGQKQRISIARAIAGKPKIYLFDDTFSALDFKTDGKIRSKLFKETKDATVIIVAQRVATIMNADQIIVLKDGEIVGIGTHEDLLNECEVYREIVYSQLSKEETELQK
ncbi:MAG: ABC transporter ATP-binding protein [Fervidobacterium sp.]